MAAQHAVIFALVVVAMVFAVTRWRVEPVLALIVGGAAFGIGAGLSVGQMGKSFGNGFGVAAGGPGLAVIAAAWIGAMAAEAGGVRFLAAWAARRRGGVARATPLVGVFAGMGASPIAAFALLRPLGEAVAADPVRLVLAIVAGQGLLLPSPVVMAATVILGADWRLVLAIGLPCAAIIVCAGGLVRWAPSPPPLEQAMGAPRMLPAAGLVAVSAAVTALLIVQAVGDIPSEPLGGGSARALLLGLGRPFILLLVGVSTMAACSRRAAIGGAAGIAIGRAAPMVLLLGAASGLQSMAMDSRMADTLAEALAGWHAGLLAPFLVAACLKMLVGSSPVAAISAAGLLQPALAGLGLDDAAGHACAALAVGAGAMAGLQVNDGLFWLASDAAGMRPVRAMVWLGGGTLLQGLAAVALLWLMHAAVLAV
jgi:GntP family gluconate:H+ symporter